MENFTSPDWYENLGRKPLYSTLLRRNIAGNVLCKLLIQAKRTQTP